MGGSKLFRRDRRGRRGGVMTLYLREGFGCLELSNEKIDWLWVKIKGKAGKADILVGVCSRPPNQDEEVDELFYKVLADV